VIDYKYYERLFSEDSKPVSGMSKCPKLTTAHIKPNNFQKMVVSFATQVSEYMLGVLTVSHSNAFLDFSYLAEQLGLLCARIGNPDMNFLKGQ